MGLLEIRGLAICIFGDRKSGDWKIWELIGSMTGELDIRKHGNWKFDYLEIGDLVTDDFEVRIFGDIKSGKQRFGNEKLFVLETRVLFLEYWPKTQYLTSVNLWIRIETPL